MAIPLRNGIGHYSEYFLEIKFLNFLYFQTNLWCQCFMLIFKSVVYWELSLHLSSLELLVFNAILKISCFSLVTGKRMVFVGPTISPKLIHAFVCPENFLSPRFLGLIKNKSLVINFLYISNNNFHSFLSWIQIL